MIKINFVIIAFILLTFITCKKDKIECTKDKVDGFVQKGPFLNGTSIGLYELNDSYSETGKSFISQIADNSGFFQINNISLISQYVLLKADGYYFNEVTGTNSSSPITLYGLTDLTNKTSINVNILSHLEKSRIEYLIENGMPFAIAKKNAELEILNIFSFHKSDIVDSDLLNIAQDGDNNAILLAISIIVQGYRTEAELSELLANIGTDIRQDGILNSASLGSLLINDAKLLNLAQIRTNIENRYANIGMIATIPDFEKYINLFVDSSSYIFNKYILYPFIVNSKQNLLNDSSYTVITGSQYSIGAFIPIGTSLKVIAKGSPGYSLSGSGVWTMQNIGWTFISYWPDSMEFRATGIDQTVDIPFQFGPSSSLDFFIYENNSIAPTRTKTIISN